MDGTLWKVSDVAAYLAVSVAWVYERVERGDIPHMKIGAHVRFKRQEIEGWAEEHRRPQPAASGGSR